LNNRLIKRFIIVFCSVLGAFLIPIVGLGAAIMIREHLNKTPYEIIEANRALNTGVKESSATNLLKGVPDFTSFIILGTDGGLRSDVIMVGVFNSETKQLDLVSVPRDTLVEISKEGYDFLTEKKKYAPKGKHKINEIQHHAGEEYGVSVAVNEVEILLGIKGSPDRQIKYYVTFGFEAFRNIIDEMGGVEFDVPRRMYYADPFQNLSINLQPGLQMLNGSDAEGLVRFRQYVQGDLQRVEVQQDFMKAWIAQLLDNDNLLDKLKTLYGIYTAYVDTNVDVSDIVRYYIYVNDLDIGAIRTHTLPVIQTEYGILPDYNKIRTLMEDIFSGAAAGETPPPAGEAGMECSIFPLRNYSA